MRISLLFTMTVLIFCPQFFTLKAQERHHCHSHELMLKQIAEHPEMEDRMMQNERHTVNFENGLNLRNNPQVTVPVVVHVVYNTQVKNISDAQIRSQIDALNRDFNKQNTDINRVPSEFASIAAACGIKFQLAVRDPQGNPTLGIVRHATTREAWGDNDEIKLPSFGGFRPWDAAKYLNIYVCDLERESLGYASFPGAPAMIDGVVIDYKAFGTTGTATAPYNKGRTCVHEVGHWLNLIHIWGDKDCGDDLIKDTPRQKRANFGNVVTPQYSTCTGSQTRDMCMNFMDYVNDECMFMFTEGQKARMLATLSQGGARAKISESDGLKPVQTTACKVLKPIVQDVRNNTATITWNQIMNNSNFTVEYRIMGSDTWVTNQTATNVYVFTNLAQGSIYECRIKGACANDYSEIQTFETPKVKPLTTEDKKVDFGIYPNPVVQDAQLMFSNVAEGEVNIQVFDSNGILKKQVAKRLTKNTPSVSLDMTEYPCGFYLVVAEQNGFRTVQKLLKVSQ